MINVSSAWKAAHRQTILPETFVEIIMDAFDPDVSSNVDQIYDTPSAIFSNSEAIVNATSYPTQGQYALLEQNLWLLDGSKEIVSDVSSYSATGYVSEEDATGALTVYTSTAQENGIPGFTIVWSAEYDEYATDFVVTVYNGSTVVATTTVSDNDSSTSVVPLQITTPYTRVGITIKEWNTPNHRKRIDSLCYGFHWVFDKKDIIAFTHERTGDLMSAEVSRNEITFSLNNSDGVWNPFNPQGLGQYLSEQQKVTVRYGMDVNGNIEWIPGGIFYLSEWNASPNGLEANFVAKDILGLMGNIFYSRSYVEITGSPVDYAGDGAIFWSYDDGSPATGEYVVDGEEYLLYDIIYAVPWQHSFCSFAKIALKSDPSSKQGWVVLSNLNIEIERPMDVGDLWLDFLNTENLPEDFKIDGSPLYFGSPYTPIKIDRVPASTMIQLVANLGHKRHWVDRSGVLQFALEDRGLGLSGYKIVLDVSNSYPEVNLTQPVGEITCILYPPTESDNIMKLGEHHLYGGGPGVTLTIDNKLMCGLDPALGEWVHSIVSNRKVISGEFRADPRLDLFDAVEVETKYGYISPVVITKIKYTFSGTFWATFEGRVIEG